MEKDKKVSIISRSAKQLQLKDIPSLLKIYEDEMDDYEEHLKIGGKPLGQANRENPGWYAYYDERRIQIRAVLKIVEKEVAKVRSKLFRSFTEGYSVDLGQQEKEKYINSEPKYLEAQGVLIEVEELYERYSSIVRSFENRGYALRNITELIVASLDNAEV